MVNDAVETNVKEKNAQIVWPWWARLGFRFAFIYWVLWMLPRKASFSLVDLLPWGSHAINRVLGWPLGKLTPWVGAHVFRLSSEVATWYTGDDALGYIAVACIAVLALIGMVLWSAIDERKGRRKQYRTAYAWLTLVLRVTLAATMFSYGFAKIFPMQFRPPSLYDLTSTFGASTPMHLLWTFMGASRPYSIFGGLLEVVAGFLLLFRRTTTLGAIAAAAILLNVVMLNICYDVPVKLYSLNLLFLSLFLLLPDAMPMWHFFVRRSASMLTGIAVRRPERHSLRLGAYVLQLLVLISVLHATAWSTYREVKIPATRPTLYGVWTVEKTEGIAGRSWSTIIVGDSEPMLGNTQMMLVLFADGTKRWFPTKIDELAQNITFPGRKKQSDLHWIKAGEPGSVVLSGTWDGVPVSIVARKTNPNTFPLQTSGFHWVQVHMGMGE